VGRHALRQSAPQEFLRRFDPATDGKLVYAFFGTEGLTLTTSTASSRGKRNSETSAPWAWEPARRRFFSRNS
jgi:hypothetical protein